MKNIILIPTFLFISFNIFAQNQKFTLVKDAQTNEALPLVLGGLLNTADSSVIKAIQADENGKIIHSGTEKTDVIIQLRYLGYDTYTFRLNKGELWPDTIQMFKSGITLKGVQISGEKVPMAVKNDTVEFNAGAFKVRPNDMAEDLIKKLPGMQVEKDGTVKTQGEQVTKITVDGKPFFGNDPLLATKNIPADAIDKVQVFERKSDQATFSGFDDGNTERSINFTLKPDKRKAKFGRIEAGAGTEDRYESSGTFFDFNGGKQLSVMGMSNNANKSGFTSDDAMSFSNASGGGNGGPGGPGGMGGGMRGGQGGDNIFSLLGANTIGINRNSTGGINFRDTWGKTEFTGSYFLSNTKSENSSDTYRETFLESGSLFSSGNSSSLSTNNSHRINLSFDYKIDEFNSLKFEPSINYSDNISESSSLNLLKNSSDVQLNKVNALVNSDTKNWRLQGQLLYRHKFLQEGRTLSLSVNPRYSDNQTNKNNFSQTSIFQAPGTQNDSLNQEVINDQIGKGLGANVSYTEPLGKIFSLEMSYNYNYDLNSRNRETFAFDPTDNKYDLFDALLSNNFDNTYETHRPQVSLQVKKLKYVLTFSGAVQRAFLKSESISENLPFSKSFTNFLPGINARFTLSKNRSVNVNYRTSTRQPAIDDIQPVPDLSDPLRIKIGNPNLGQEYNHSLRVNYRLFDMANNTFISFGLRGEYNFDKIVSNVSIDQFGVETTSKENRDGVYSGSFFANYGRPYRKINLNVSSFTNYRRDISLINSEDNKGDVWSTSGRLSCGYNITETWDVNLGGSVTYNEAKYALQSNLNNTYTDLTSEFSSTADLPFKFRLATDLNFTQRQGLSGGFSQSFTIWNASITRSFLANNSFEISLYAFDLLRQNVAINRNTTSFYIEDSKALTLSNYYMLTARYFLNKQKPTMGKTGQRFFKMMH